MTGSAAELAPVAAIPDAGVAAAGDGTLARKPKPKGGIVMTVVLAVVAVFWISPLVLLAITAILLILKVPIGVLLSAMLAFALAKLRMRFRATIMFTVFLGLTIPIYITIVPVFVMMRSIGQTDSLLGLVGPYLAFGIPFEVLVLQAFFRQLPDEILESARIDGANEWRIFFTIVLPLSTPALVTVFIPDAGSTWNQLLVAPILPHSDENKTIPVGLLNFMGQFANNNTGLAAGILIAVLPILLAYIFLQRWIVGGLTAGATKG